MGPNGLPRLNVELAERLRVINQAVLDLEELINRWSRPGIFVVADSSFYIHGPDRIDEVDFAGLLHGWGEPIHLLVPILVLDELDGLKRSGRRGRAQLTLAILDEVLIADPSGGLLRPEDHSALAGRTGGHVYEKVTLEVVFDPFGHIRLPIADDEIIDRAVAVQPLAGREIRFVTCDTGQHSRARFAGLEAIKVEPRDP